MITVKVRETNGYIIQYNLSTKTFEAVNDTGVITLLADTESDLFAKIEAAIKRRSKVAKSKAFPMDVLMVKYSAIIPAKITSIADDGEVWLTYTARGDREASRHKESLKYGNVRFYPIAEKNVAVFKDYSDKVNQVAKIQAEINRANENLESRIDIKALVEV
jgi:hypothetical protein